MTSTLPSRQLLLACGIKSELRVVSPSIQNVVFELCLAAVLLVRTYAFMGRKLWMFFGLTAVLCGVMAYQLFAAIHEILCEHSRFPRCTLVSELNRAAICGPSVCKFLGDVNPASGRRVLQNQGPFLPMSKPHSAHILGFFVRSYDSLESLLLSLID